MLTSHMQHFRSWLLTCHQPISFGLCSRITFVLLPFFQDFRTFLVVASWSKLIYLFFFRIRELSIQWQKILDLALSLLFFIVPIIVTRQSNGYAITRDLVSAHAAHRVNLNKGERSPYPSDLVKPSRRRGHSHSFYCQNRVRGRRASSPFYLAKASIRRGTSTLFTQQNHVEGWKASSSFVLIQPCKKRGCCHSPRSVKPSRRRGVSTLST